MNNNMLKVLISGGNGDIANAINNLLDRDRYCVLAPSHDKMDVTNWESVEKCIKSFVPDVLINNAGYVVPCSIKNNCAANIQKHIDTNLTGTFFCSAVALKYNKDVMIINIASAASVEPHSTWSEYCATKSGVVMATKCWAEDGVYTVAISPGRTKTKMRKSLFPNEDQSTLLDPIDFAKIVLNAIKGKYKSGDHIIVRKQNINELLNA